jgi:fumarylacetoacetate (FAA) hydrolase
MKFARVRDTTGVVRVGVYRDDRVHYVDDDLDDLLPLIQAGNEALQDAARSAISRGAGAEAGDLQFLSPLATPPTFRDFYAFEQHVKAGRSWRGLEMDPAWYQIPVFYFSNPYAFRGDGPVPMAPGSTKFDFELEVAAVITRAGADLTTTEAEDTVGGFCVLNDWSARDIQQYEMTLSMGPVKGKDTATGMGPYFVTKDELADFREGSGYKLRMSCSVNDRTYSDAIWSDVYWSFAEMAAYASRGTSIRPGDVLGSGTCGTGCILELSRGPGGDKYPWLKPGDEVVARVEGLGELRNTIVPAEPVIPLRPEP